MPSRGRTGLRFAPIQSHRPPLPRPASSPRARATTRACPLPPPPHSHIPALTCRTFTDLKLVLDNRTYENFEGGWRDLLARIKWDTVKSVAKSVTGLQGRKFKVWLGLQRGKW